MPHPRPSGRRLLLALAASALASLPLVGGLVLVGRVVAPAWARTHRADLGAALITGAYLALLAGLMIGFGGPAGVKSRLGFRYTGSRDLLLALGAWLASLAAGVAATTLLAPLTGPPRSNAIDLLRVSFDPLFVALIVPTVCVLAPAVEELLFRGALLGWLAGVMPVWPAGALSALLFAAAHLLPPLFPVLFVFGLGAALVYLRTGSTFNSFAMHATQNTLAVVVAYQVLARHP